MRQGDEFFHRRGVEQVGVTPGRFETFLGRFGLSSFAADLHGEGAQLPQPLQTLCLHPVGKHRDLLRTIKVRLPVDQRIQEGVDKLLRA